MWCALLAAATVSEEWGEDEVFLLVASIVLSVLGAIAWGRSIRATPGLGGGRGVLLPLMVSLTACWVLLFYVTWFWTAREIRGGQAYAWLVLAMGGAWLTLIGGVFRWLGIGLRDDACERRNPSAAMALSGGWFGAMMIFCGSNTGEGPSFWNNVFSAALGGSAWVAGWMVLSLMTGVSRAVTEDRDRASGLRLGAFLLAMGLVFGRALAGNWESESATVGDFIRDGWPGFALLTLAAMGQIVLRPTPRNPKPSMVSAGLLPALLYLLLAFSWVAKLGWWEGAPR